MKTDLVFDDRRKRKDSMTYPKELFLLIRGFFDSFQLNRNLSMRSKSEFLDQPLHGKLRIENL